MTHEAANELACGVVARNPHLDDLADDTRLWLVNDIAGALYNAWHEGRNEGFVAGAESVGAKWRESIRDSA